METPIMINPSAIKLDAIKACIKTGAWVCFLTALICIPGTYILVDQKFMNKPVNVIERAAFYNSGGQRIYVTEDAKEWFVSDDSATKLTPVKEK